MDLGFPRDKKHKQKPRPPFVPTGCIRLATAAKLREIDRRRGCLPTPDLVRAVAQLGRAPASGAGGRGFESRQPDFFLGSPLPAGLGSTTNDLAA